MSNFNSVTVRMDIGDNLGTSSDFKLLESCGFSIIHLNKLEVC